MNVARINRVIGCALVMGAMVGAMHGADAGPRKGEKAKPKGKPAQPKAGEESGKGEDETNAPPQRIFVAPRTWLGGKLAHRNDPTAAKKMQESIELLSKFGDAGTGLTKRLQDNSAAFGFISETLDDLRARVLDNEFAANFGTNSWFWLETNFYGNFGYTIFQGQATRAQFESRLAARLSFLGTSVQAYKALVDGQTLLGKQAATDQKNEAARADALTKGPAEAKGKGSPTNAVSQADAAATNAWREFSILAVLDYARSLDGAWRAGGKISQSISNVPALLDDLYRQIDVRTDLQGASLLVASVGTGMDDPSMNLLSNQVVHLRYQVLSNFVNTFYGKQPANAAPSQELLTFSNSCRAVLANLIGTNDVRDYWRALTNEAPRLPEAQGEVLLTIPETRHFEQLRRQEPEAISLLSTPNTPRALPRTVTATQKAYRRKFPSNPAGAGNVAPLGFRTIAPDLITEREANVLGQATDTQVKAEGESLIGGLDLKMAVSNLSDMVESLQSVAGGLTGSSKEMMAVAGILKTGKTNLFGAVTNLLLNTNLFGPDLRNKLGESLVESNLIGNQLKFIESTLKDAKDYEAGQASLFKNFFNEVAGLQGQVRQEDLRHLQSLSVVAAQEAQRWMRLASLYEKYRGEYGDPGKTRVFRATEGEAPNGIGPAPNATRPPLVQVTPHSLILPSLRLLAFDAQRLRNWDPTNDPGGWSLIVRQRRVAAAVELLQGHFLMKTFNQRSSQDNSRLLRRELDEHKIQLHAIWSRAKESEIGLMLGDQLAFHRTGYTQEDIDALMGALQAGFVGWIGVKQ